MTLVWSDLEKYHSIVKRLDDLGMVMGSPRYAYDGNKIIVYPKPDALPFYSENVRLFSGNLDEISVWAMGVEFSRNYDRICGLKTDKRRETAENKYRNRKLLQLMKNK